MARIRHDNALPVDPRRLIAAAARRLLDGRDLDAETALHQAARESGLHDRARLPPAAMVIEAACAERRLFGGDRHEQCLAGLRATAIEAMRFLADFEPRLVGGVLEGWAGEGASVSIHLFTDDTESLLLRLADLGTQPGVASNRTGPSQTPLSHERLSFVAGGVPIDLRIFRAVDLRRRTTARDSRRATLAEVERMGTRC